jgi:hypothetical protein
MAQMQKVRKTSRSWAAWLCVVTVLPTYVRRKGSRCGRDRAAIVPEF